MEARGINLKELNNEESQEILEGIEEEEVNNITEKKSEL